MNKWLEECRILYNHFLSQRKDGWQNNKKGFTLYEQLNTIPKLKKIYPKLKTVYSQVLQNVGIRVDLGYKAFFRRLKNHEKPGYPRFKSFGRYTSFTYPCCVDIRINEDSIRLPKLGEINWTKHRNIIGCLKTVTIKYSHYKWYVFVTTDANQTKNYPKTNKTVGIDVGIETFATLHDGNKILNPRFFETKQKSLSKARRRLQKARNENDKQAIIKKRKVINKIHEKITNSRHDFVHKTVNNLIKEYDNIIIEDIDANAMIKKRWCSKQILDAAWGNFMLILSYKAENAGKTVIKVNPAYTSQTCSKCGRRTLHELKDRIFNCSCGHSEHRDMNAAKNILALGLQCLKGAEPI